MPEFKKILRENRVQHLHKNGYAYQLHLEKGMSDWQGSQVNEDKYIVIDPDNCDLTGDYMPINEAKNLIREIIEL